MNYFSLFDLEQQYTIDVNELEQRYRVLQRLTHPDKYANASDNEKRLYMQKNAQVNDAFYVLRDDVARGEHLLAVRGVDLPSEQETIGDTDFLMQQMEFRENLADAKTNDELTQLQETVTQSIQDYVVQITSLLQSGRDEDNLAAGNTLNKLKFLKKLASEVKTRKQTVDKL